MRANKEIVSPQAAIRSLVNDLLALGGSQNFLLFAFFFTVAWREKANISILSCA